MAENQGWNGLLTCFSKMRLMANFNYSNYAHVGLLTHQITNETSQGKEVTQKGKNFERRKRSRHSSRSHFMLLAMLQ